VRKLCQTSIGPRIGQAYERPDSLPFPRPCCARDALMSPSGCEGSVPASYFILLLLLLLSLLLHGSLTR